MKKVKNTVIAVIMFAILLIPAFVAGCSFVPGLVLYDRFKTEYYVGEDLDLTGGLIKYTKDGESEYVEVTLSMVTGFNSLTVGNKQLTITYKDKSIKVSYRVIAKEDTGNGGNDNSSVKTLSLKTSFKTDYYVGDNLDVTGGVLSYTVNGNSQDINITANMVSNFNTDTVGNRTLTITYNNLTVQVCYTVSQPSTPQILEMQSGPIYYCDNLDVDGMIIYLIYDKATTTSYNITSDDDYSNGNFIMPEDAMAYFNGNKANLDSLIVTENLVENKKILLNQMTEDFWGTPAIMETKVEPFENHLEMSMTIYDNETNTPMYSQSYTFILFNGIVDDGENPVELTEEIYFTNVSGYIEYIAIDKANSVCYSDATTEQIEPTEIETYFKNNKSNLQSYTYSEIVIKDRKAITFEQENSGHTTTYFVIPQKNSNGAVVRYFVDGELNGALPFISAGDVNYVEVEDNTLYYHEDLATNTIFFLVYDKANSVIYAFDSETLSISEAYNYYVQNKSIMEPILVTEQINNLQINLQGYVAGDTSTYIYMIEPSIARLSCALIEMDNATMQTISNNQKIFIQYMD